MKTQALDIETQDLQIVKTILRKHLPAHASVYVFGSRIKGNAKKFSDLDLAIDNNMPLDSNLLAELNFDFEESDLPYKVDVVDWNAISQSFQQAIHEHAQPLSYHL